jgi:fucose permease
VYYLGWIVVFLSEVRDLPLSKAGYVPTGFYTALFLGRLVLTGPTHNWLGGEHYTLTLFATITLALHLIAWQVNSAVVTSVAFSVMGFSVGPMFAAAIQVASEVIPRKVRSSALGLIFVMAQLGGSAFPALTGVIASKRGVDVLPPIAAGLIAATGVTWWFVPTAPKRRGED